MFIKRKKVLNTENGIIIKDAAATIYFSGFAVAFVPTVIGIKVKSCPRVSGKFSHYFLGNTHFDIYCLQSSISHKIVFFMSTESL